MRHHSDSNMHYDYVSPEDEEEMLRQQHSKAMSSVFEEAGKQFRKIRGSLNELTLTNTTKKADQVITSRSIGHGNQ